MTAPMPARTLKALKGSIEKWEKIVAGTGADRGTSNCPLCEAFYCTSDDDYGFCAQCPVREKVGASDCENTPYPEWAFHFPGPRPDAGWRATTPEAKALALAELEFLKSLLPSVAVRKATRRAVAGKPVPRRSRA